MDLLQGNEGETILWCHVVQRLGVLCCSSSVWLVLDSDSFIQQEKWLLQE